MANVNEKVESLHGLRVEALISIRSDCFSLEPIVNQKMKNAKKILITSATSEIFILQHGRQKAIRGFCPICEREVEMLTLDEAVHEGGQSARAIVRRVEQGNLHFAETDNGHLLICAASLEK